jgi:AAA15 family ATPase/GTPase
MLLRFNVSNFLSFDDEQEFSMISGNVEKFSNRVIKDTNIKVLKFAALYGANASGKSNLIKAIDTAKKIVVGGVENITERDLHFKLNTENKEKPSKFEFELKINDSYYAYGFTVMLHSSSILGEWLYELSPSGDKMIFERDMVRNLFNDGKKFDISSNKSKYEIYKEDIMNMKNVLFLKEINRKNLNEPDFDLFNAIYEWFSVKLTVLYPDTAISTHLNIFDRDDGFDIVKLLDYFDTGITGITLEPSSIEELRRYLGESEYNSFMDSFKKTNLQAQKHLKNSQTKRFRIKAILQTERHLFQMKYENNEWEIKKLLFEHGTTNGKVMFEFGDESDGTQRLIELLGIVHDENKDRVIIIDELDRSLHPQMTKKFVETFFKFTDQNPNQLIITTHESNLLDLQFLRRDEIWFVERNKNYSSHLYSLENFKVRFDKKIDKDYLEGRYGAVPLFKDFSSYLSDEL